MFERLDQYTMLVRELDPLPKKTRDSYLRRLCREDLFFLLWYGLGRDDIFNQWLLDRCNEVHANPNDHLDLWAREHYKSTIITFALTIQDVLTSHGDNPDPKWKGREVTVGIFSCTRPNAVGFLRQIKQEMERNNTLKELFPDILWNNPEKEAPKWSESDGLVFKRKSNPKESTIEAWGLIDGMPTGKHFVICLFDDLVTETNTTDYMIEKTIKAWELADNLGTEGGFRRYAGTIYAFNDAYATMKKRGAAIPRVHPCTKEGTWPGTPVLKSTEELTRKYRNQGVYTFSAQMLLNPVADKVQGFRPDWIRYYDGSDGSGMNIYIICDPANAKKKSSDYTYFEVIGLGQDNNYYTLDMVRDRLNLLERTQTLFTLHKKWRPMGVGYEQYGMQADIQHIEDKQQRENYRFAITELGGSMPKTDRIRRLVPIFEQKRWFMPRTCFKTDYEGKMRDLVDIFLNEEYNAFPVSAHDDMLDGRARILDESLGALFPKAVVNDDDDYGSSSSYRGSAWAS